MYSSHGLIHGYPLYVTERVQDVSVPTVTLVRCSPEGFDYLHQQARGGDVWTPGQNKYDLMNVITPEM